MPNITDNQIINNSMSLSDLEKTYYFLMLHFCGRILVGNVIEKRESYLEQWQKIKLHNAFHEKGYENHHIIPQGLAPYLESNPQNLKNLSKYEHEMIASILAFRAPRKSKRFNIWLNPLTLKDRILPALKDNSSFPDTLTSYIKRKPFEYNMFNMRLLQLVKLELQTKEFAIVTMIDERVDQYLTYFELSYLDFPQDTQEILKVLPENWSVFKIAVCISVLLGGKKFGISLINSKAYLDFMANT